MKYASKLLLLIACVMMLSGVAAATEPEEPCPNIIDIGVWQETMVCDGA